MSLRILRHLIAILLPLLITGAAARAQDVHTPAAGGKERKAIMDALRVPFGRDLKQPVIFVVDMIKVSEDWAAVRVTPQTPGGGKIDYSRTKYKEQVEAGMFDPSGEALLQMNGGPDAWKVIRWQFGQTDTALSSWITSCGAPASLGR